jgi:hypothetical protein
MSENIYMIYAVRNKSQFNQTKQVMRCKVIEARKNYLLVESLKRYNKKYKDSQKVKNGFLIGKIIRRINRDQAKAIIDERTGRWLSWETVRRREGTLISPGRAKGGR